jgi:hypothetical protein
MAKSTNKLSGFKHLVQQVKIKDAAQSLLISANNRMPFAKERV